MSLWPLAEQTRFDALAWLDQAKVTLDKDPRDNIGSLHAKVAETRDWANRVRDLLFRVMNIGIELRREAGYAEAAYDQAMASAMMLRADEDAVKKFKSKEEREAVLRQGILEIYQTKVTTSARIAEWEAFTKAVNLIYYSLSNTRDDIGTQVAILKQQMFSGEVQPNPELGKISSLTDLLGDNARTLLSSLQMDSSPEPSGPGGETAW